jgi:hypothetical protein
VKFDWLNFWFAEVWIDALVAVYEHNAQVGGHETPVAFKLDVVALANVIDVNGYAGVGADSVLLHLLDELGLGEVVRRSGLAFLDFDLYNNWIYNF